MLLPPACCRPTRRSTVGSGRPERYRPRSSHRKRWETNAQRTHRYLWSPVTGQLVRIDIDTDGNGSYDTGSDRTALPVIDAYGNPVAWLDSAGDVRQRDAFTPSGTRVADPSPWSFNGHTIQIGYRLGLADGNDQTFTAGGLHDPIAHGVHVINPHEFWGEFDHIEPVYDSWWQYAGTHLWNTGTALPGQVNNAFRSGIHRIGSGFDWVADRFDHAGGWMIHQFGWGTPPPALLLTMTGSSVSRLAGGIVRLHDVQGVVEGTMQSYQEYRAAGLGGFRAGVLASPIVGGSVQGLGQTFTGRSYASHDFGRGLDPYEWGSSIAFTLSGAAGTVAAGVRLAGGVRAAAVPDGVTRAAEHHVGPKVSVSGRAIELPATGGVALGKDVAGQGMKQLARVTESSWYRHWERDGLTRRTVDRRFGRAFHQAVERAPVIRFSLDGIDDIAAAVKAGKSGFRFPNMTNAELEYLSRSPHLLEKTVFYRTNPASGVPQSVPSPFQTG